MDRIHVTLFKVLIKKKTKKKNSPISIKSRDRFGKKNIFYPSETEWRSIQDGPIILTFLFSLDI